MLFGNLAVVVAATLLVLNGRSGSVNVNKSILTNQNTQSANPLDPLSAADIAVNAARMTNMAEATSVVNLADSVSAELSTQTVGDVVAAKPQILSSVVKTKADVKEYKVVSGDTLSSLSSKFGVTSDSIKWSNGINSASLTPGTNILIPPIDGIVHTVKTGDTPDSLASKYSANKDQITVFNDAEVGGLRVGDKIVIPGGSIAPPAPVSTPSTATRVTYGSSPVYGGNGYDYGWCTWYSAGRRAEMGRPIPSNLGNAYTWYIRAQAQGLSVGTTPQVGAVMVFYWGPTSPMNHVGVVEQVNGDGSYWISEMNASGQVSITNSASTGGWGRVDYRFFPNAGNSKFIY